MVLIHERNHNSVKLHSFQTGSIHLFACILIHRRHGLNVHTYLHRITQFKPVFTLSNFHKGTEQAEWIHYHMLIECNYPCLLTNVREDILILIISFLYECQRGYSHFNYLIPLRMSERIFSF